MSDPAHPVQTATLTELAMLSPHESLNLNPKRGLLAAVIGNPRPIRAWCRSTTSRRLPPPGAQSTAPGRALGHESGFSPDGKTFYATGTAWKSVTAVDVTDPKDPHAVWQGNVARTA